MAYIQFITLSYSPKFKFIKSIKEIKTLETFVLESLKQVLNQKNANVGKMIFQKIACQQKFEIEKDILNKAETISKNKLNTPLLLRRQAFRIILRLLIRKIRSQNITSSANDLLIYVSRLELSPKNHQVSM